VGKFAIGLRLGAHLCGSELHGTEQNPRHADDAWLLHCGYFDGLRGDEQPRNLLIRIQSSG
jgi:hypothetical protein